MDTTTLSNLILFAITALSASLVALWLGLTLWTWQDMQARSRDPIAQLAASALVFFLPGFGLIVHLLLRPRETLADAYERSLEEEALLQDIEERPHCPGCGRQVKATWQVCPYCHTRLKKPCHHCGNLLELAWNLCPVCATPHVGHAEDDLIENPLGRADLHRQADEQSPYDYQGDAGDLQFVDD